MKTEAMLHFAKAERNQSYTPVNMVQKWSTAAKILNQCQCDKIEHAKIFLSNLI
jgi:hypothetical protein